MRVRPGGEALIGLGVDIGGSGVRVASFGLDPDGHLEARGSCELAHEGRSLGESAARAVEALLADDEQHSIRPLRVGIAAPGIKTADGRGILRARNVADSPHLLDEFALCSRRSGLDGIVAPTRLESDALAALFGETVVCGGLLENVRHALFIGPGSGLAECKLVNGKPKPTSGTRVAELPPTCTDGAFADLEEESSLSGLVHEWSKRSATKDGLEHEIEDAAEGGDATARALLDGFATALARVIELRSPEIEELRMAADGSPPALLIRTRRGIFFAKPSIQSIVVPILRAAALRHGATLITPVRPAASHAACAGALSLSLQEAPRPPLS